MNTHTVCRSKYYHFAGRTLQETIDAAEDELNKLFAEGWEIENEITVGQEGIQYVLSREVEDPGRQLTARELHVLLAEVLRRGTTILWDDDRRIAALEVSKGDWDETVVKIITEKLDGTDCMYEEDLRDLQSAVIDDAGVLIRTLHTIDEREEPDDDFTHKHMKHRLMFRVEHFMTSDELEEIINQQHYETHKRSSIGSTEERARNDR